MGRCFQMENAKKADAALNYIHKQTSLTDWERYTLVTAVIHALDKVGNNVGMQQSYLKRWTPASYKNIDFKLPVCIKGAAGRHIEGDCLLAAANSRSPWLGTGGLYGRHDLAYVDPPYSPLAYSTYYHIWDSIVRWDKPTTALASRRRIDRVGIGNTMKSVWNVRGKAIVAFDILIARLPARYVLISYNDESIIDKDDLLLLSERHGTVKCETIEYQRNTMWNAVRDGRKVIKGQTNSELLILIDKG